MIKTFSEAQNVWYLQAAWDRLIKYYSCILSYVVLWDESSDDLTWRQRNSPWLKNTPASHREMMKMGKYSEQFALAKQEYDRQASQVKSFMYLFISWMETRSIPSNSLGSKDPLELRRSGGGGRRHRVFPPRVDHLQREVRWRDEKHV